MCNRICKPDALLWTDEIKIDSVDTLLFDQHGGGSVMLWDVVAATEVGMTLIVP